MEKLQEALNKHVGKTIQSIEAYSSWFRVNFTDGTSVEVSAYGSDEGAWISID